MLGSAATFVAVPWFVLSTTGSATKAGLVSAAAATGVVVSGLAFGPVLDRLGHGALAVVADGVAAVAIGVVPLLQAGWPPTNSGTVALWAVAGLVFVASAAGMVSATARQSLLATLSAAAGVSLSRVSAAYWTMQRAALVLAAVPVGVLIGVLGPLGVLWVDAATFALAALVILCGLKVSGPVDAAEDGYLARLRAGLSFMRRDELVWVVLGVAVLLAALEAPLLTVLVPTLAGPANPGTLSWLVAGYAGGMLAGAIGYGLAGAKVPKRAVAMVCLVTVGLGYLALQWLPGLAWHTAVLAVMGMATGPLAPLVVSTVQARTPPPMLGRVTGALLSSVMAAIPMGRAVAGYAVDTAGIGAVLTVSAVCYLACAGYLENSSRLRRSLET